MKSARFILGVSVLAAPLMAAGLDIDPSMSNLHARIDEVVLRLRHKDPKAREFRKARTVHEVHISGRSQFVALVSIEGFNGGNNSATYMTLLDVVRDSVVEIGTLKIGARGWRQVNPSQFTDRGRLITLGTSTYARTDSICCPTIAGEATFELSYDGIREVQ